MATQTCFDLNAAIESWRNELAAQLQLTPDDRRELEKHLVDSMAELRQHGLSEEESFWLARRRIGQPERLAEEFSKADPNQVWRERVFWMALAILLFFSWDAVVDIIPFRNAPLEYILLVYLPPICTAILLAKGQLSIINNPVLKKVFKNRWLFAGIAIVFLLSTHGLQMWESYTFWMHHELPKMFWLNQIQMVGFPLMIVALAAWLLPAQKKSMKIQS